MKLHGLRFRGNTYQMINIQVFNKNFIMQLIEKYYIHKIVKFIKKLMNNKHSLQINKQFSIKFNY